MCFARSCLPRRRDPQPAELLPALKQAERFLLLVRSFAGKRADVAEAESYRLAHDLHEGTPLADVVTMLADRVSLHFSIAAFQTTVDELFSRRRNRRNTEDDGRGFYDLSALKFVLFEYEESLRVAAKSPAARISWDDFRGASNSVEHIYPQKPETAAWPLFNDFSSDQQRFLSNTLGNLVAVSVAKNASLSRKSFAGKKQGTDRIPGFSQGSFSELEIAQHPDWTPSTILQRGIRMLHFVEEHWNVQLGSGRGEKSPPQSAILVRGMANLHGRRSAKSSAGWH